ncbi:MAG: PrgI family protein [Candidatus Moraniibacteriota bacterium]
MMFSVPQFIDVEDKIAGPLTWRQLLWMIGMGITLLVLYNMIGTTGFFVIGVPLILLFSALAFYRPHGTPLIVFLFHGFSFLFRPKVAVWERPMARVQPTPAAAPRVAEAPKEKHITQEELRRLANIMDSH